MAIVPGDKVLEWSKFVDRQSRQKYLVVSVEDDWYADGEDPHLYRLRGECNGEEVVVDGEDDLCPLTGNLKVQPILRDRQNIRSFGQHLIEPLNPITIPADFYVDLDLFPDGWVAPEDEAPADGPAEEPPAEPVGEAAAELEHQPVDEAANPLAAEAANLPADGSAGQLVDEPARQGADEPAGQLADDPARQAPDEPAGQRADEVESNVLVMPKLITVVALVTLRGVMSVGQKEKDSQKTIGRKLEVPSTDLPECLKSPRLHHRRTKYTTADREIDSAKGPEWLWYRIFSTLDSVRYMTNGLKAYYLPYKTFVDQCTPPAFITYFGLMRQILIRERIDIVHGHQATSALCQEMCFHARTMGYKTVYTDHSLFGFGDAACIAINKVLKVFLTDVHHCICVSHTNKENLILRAAIRPDDVSVIPNAVDASRFTPNPSPRNDSAPQVTIVVVSRLTFRKGIDILIDVMPEISRRFPHVHWIIAGDGPKRMDIEQMLERHKLHDRTELLGKVPHSQVRDVLLRGDIFLNCSLTEAFCIAIVEAASCGLCVVSTDVGGVPEVLPPSMIRLCPPNAEKFVEAVSETISEDVPYRDRWDQHQKVSEMYSWNDVARRTADVYKKVMDTPDMTLKQRIRLMHTTGPALGKVAIGQLLPMRVD
ncbi:N-acetylglucosaminyl-phosphatidylinositol biosynthetic protein, putative [Perkinsus marinus ATCC 50983]|uniref:N-acetylglucosaminyl-phosphatidylinositol biosynthetic protein, putative n=1 Tax=Perkinsus marinus (strain ATCC 50983 / TXsc) TaxID=423536 RepID=C5L124_PERM5|nr:N-acetylglucosaminyl-phosphatidylinositol biosynthetic protein, putative [Perkinsus marinus ATCC 50983]EER09666.1 N-acetylglucosaminyl-phosphatidylinositol biosynthetic protein, putative [Perkinsus marinus ATCC 50983]|eukprot:XP_002777871.1 N-acetylglucosaminyl-phosphatidylinositol biosynthetic protein, putative [Perkinsus marinus ATCC 50983]